MSLLLRLSRPSCRLATAACAARSASAASSFVAARAAPVAAVAPFAQASSVRAFHAARPILGGGGHDDGEFHHGTDFLSRENVERRVKMVLNTIEKVDKSRVNDLSSSFKSLGLDSLDEVEVVMMLEDEFVIDIQDEVASNILSIQDAINYIVNHPFAANDEVHH